MRIIDLIEALHLLKEHLPNVHLLVVGAGELLEQAEARALVLGVPVTFAGFLNQSELPKAYVVSDCLVLPSDYGETWGLVVNEAMACGIAVIVSDRVGCRPDLVEEGLTGYAFTFGDTNDLATKMAAMATDRSRREAMGKEAQKRFGTIR